jgi:hypothetical protein
MSFGANPTTTTQGTLPNNQFPLSSVAVPGHANGDLTALEGGPESTDANSNKTAPVSMYVKDGNDLTQGLTTDAAVTGDNSGTISAKLRGLSKIWFDIWDSVNHRIKVDGSGVTQPVSGTFWQATQPVSGTITANAGTNLNTSLLALESGGHLANIDSHTPAFGQAAMSASVPVTLASDQTPLVSATATRSNVVAAVSDTSLLASNASRKGAIFYNDSTAILYLAYGAAAASTTSYSVQIPAQGFFELPPQPIYTGAIRGIWSAVNGTLRITEMS